MRRAWKQKRMFRFFFSFLQKQITCGFAWECESLALLRSGSDLPIPRIIIFQSILCFNVPNYNYTGAGALAIQIFVCVAIGTSDSQMADEYTAGLLSAINQLIRTLRLYPTLPRMSIPTVALTSREQVYPSSLKGIRNR